MSTRQKDFQLGKRKIDTANSLQVEIDNITVGYSEPPTILSKIIEITNDPTTPVEIVADLLSSHPAIAARALRLSNSAFYGRSRRISNLQEAVVFLGFYAVRSMVMTSIAHSHYCRPGDSANSFYQKLWVHSIATAVFSRILAKNYVSDEEEAYVAGLLHDFGKFILLERFRDKYVDIIRDSTAKELLKQEEHTFGFSHPFIGAILLDQWLFPTDLVETIASHHDNPSLESLPGIVGLANVFVTVHGYNIHSATKEEETLIKYFGFGKKVCRFKELLEEQLGLLGVK